MVQRHRLHDELAVHDRVSRIDRRGGLGGGSGSRNGEQHDERHASALHLPSPDESQMTVTLGSAVFKTVACCPRPTSRDTVRATGSGDRATRGGSGCREKGPAFTTANAAAAARGTTTRPIARRDT